MSISVPIDTKRFDDQSVQTPEFPILRKISQISGKISQFQAKLGRPLVSE